MNTKHTPGPWAVTGTRTRGRYCIDGIGTHRQAIATTEWQETDGRAKANARLIAASPDYDEAARDAVDSASPVDASDDNSPVIISRDAFRKLQAAIAKATGADPAR